MEAVRGVYERWEQGDFSASVDLFDPAVEFVIGPGFPDAGTYAGLDGIAGVHARASSSRGTGSRSRPRSCDATPATP